MPSSLSQLIFDSPGQERIKTLTARFGAIERIRVFFKILEDDVFHWFYAINTPKCEYKFLFASRFSQK